MDVIIPEQGLPSKEALLEFCKHRKEIVRKSALQAEKEGKKLTFLFLDWEAYGDREYYYCEEDDAVYSNYIGIGD